MRSKKSASVFAAIAGILAFCSVALAPSASAAPTLDSPPSTMATAGIWWQGSKAEVDNNPGNGAAAWIWLYSAGGEGSTVQYRTYDGAWGINLYTRAGTSTSWNLGRDVWAFRLCNHPDAAHQVYDCSGWVYF